MVKVIATGSWYTSTSVWSINLDGSHDSMVYVDSSLIGFTYNSSESFSPSPDGRSIAWTRTNRDYSQNIITIDLVNGKETNLPFGKGQVGDVFWSHNNFIIFSQYTKNSRNYDLWIGSPDAGESLTVDSKLDSK